MQLPWGGELSGFPYLLLGGWGGLFGIAAYCALVEKRRIPLVGDIFLAVSLVLFAGLRGNSLDYDEYVLMFEAVRDATQETIIERALLGKDLIFGSLLIFVSNTGLGVFAVFLCAAILSVGFKVAAFRKAFGSSLLALFVFFCTYYFLHDFTQIRAAIAISLCFCALVAVAQEHRTQYLLMSLAAIGFHAQAALVVACTAPLFFGGKERFILMVINSTIIIIATPILMNIVILFDNRPGIAESVEVISFNGALSAIFNVGLLLSIFFSCHKNFRNSMEREISVASIILVVSGLGFLLFTFSSSVTMAWRGAEMFMSFGVFVVVAALRGTAKPTVFLLSIAYCLFNITLLVRGPLLVEYKFSENLGAYCASFW